ncbi:hypothetical protein ACIA8C_22520 [Nocardia sp. NPDC051321]|uniref:hypothetical protein n=1 Tax=Nocardia sp. NPDC051321 TaxID=3364323 RepID=UPI0037BDECBB
MIDPSILEARRVYLLDQLRELRWGVAELAEGYGALPASGLLIDTEGIGALTTPAYCVAGAREVFEEATIELDAAVDALDRAGMYTTRIRSVVLD